jgi:hypothetical protein
VAALLEAAHAELLAEVRGLARRGLLEREEECIHAGARGEWSTYMANAHWRARVDAHGCSADTPAACRVMRAAARAAEDAGAGAGAVLRVGYSVVAGGAHLAPHCGLTNAQLKFHLGLEVPADPRTGLGCARIRVGNETRRWAAGSVLFFDDSFEHEVPNDCAVARSVFQLVVEHPDLRAALAADAALRDPFAQVRKGGHGEL